MFEVDPKVVIGCIKARDLLQKKQHVFLSSGASIFTLYGSLPKYFKISILNNCHY